MGSKELKHSFPAFQQVRSRQVVDASLARVEIIQPILLPGVAIVVEEGLHKAIPSEYEWSLAPNARDNS